MSRGVTAEHVVRKLFIFLKESLDFELEQDDLIQRDLLDEKEKEDRICKDQCKAFWCERYLKLLIMKKRCTKFIEFFQETSSNRHFISEQILRTQANLKETDLKARVNAQRDQFTLTHELLQKNLYFLYTELEPREIADLMFQSGFISCNDHDSITDSQQKYVRFMSLLGILKEKQLYSQFARTLQTSMKYIPVLERMKEDKILYIKSIVGECVLCIQHNFTLLQKELPDADYTTAVMDHLFDKTNLYDIDHCKGNIRKKSKLLKILLMKGNPACMELLKVIETNLERDNFIKKLKRRSDDINDRGKPDLSPHLKRLSTSCLQEQNEFLLDELEPIDLCDFLLEERAIEIMTHDKITETEERRQQVKDLLQILQKNENDCFHYFLYIIEKNEFNDIRDVLAGPLEALRDEKMGQSDWKLEHKVEKVTDDPKDDTINLRLAVQGRNADRVERDLLQQFKSSASGPLQLTMAYGHMDIENVSCGSVVLQLRPLTDQAVQTLLNARENNKLVDIIFAMLKNIKIADKMDKTEPLEIKVQVCYASPPKENPVYETRNAKQIKHRLGVYKNKLVSDIEPSALASALSKSFPKSKFESVEQAGSCPRRVERLLSLIDEGESDLVYEFVTVLENFGYHEIVKLIDPPDIRWTAKNIREKIVRNFNRILEEMQMTFARETLSYCIGDVAEITQKIFPRNGNRRQRMSNFLQFILKEDHNVIEFEKMLKRNGLEKLLKIDKNVQEELLSSQNIEVIFVKDPKPSSSEILFESVITLSKTGRKSESNIKQIQSQDLQGQKSTPNYPNCQEHIKNMCTLYCEQCDTSICDLCGTSKKHLTHDVSTISSIIERKKKTLHKYLIELETSLFPKYQEYVDNIPVQKADLVKNSRKLTIDLDKQEEDWHRQIDAIIKKQKSELEEMHSKQLANLNKQEEEIAHIISEIKHSITDLKDVLESNDVGFVFAYKPRNEKFRRLPPKLTISLPKINKKQLFQQFGSLVSLLRNTEDTSYPMDTSEARSSPLKAFCDESQITTIIRTQYEDGESCHRSVTCHSDDEIWTCRLDNIMRLYSLHGQLVKSIKTKSGNMPQDIAVTWSGDLVYTDRGDRTVNIVKETQIHSIRLRGWRPWCVSSTSFGDLLVVMDNDDKQTKVVRYSGSTEKQSIQYDDQGNSLLLSGIYICENGNLDICVSDNSAGAVVVVNQAGELRFRYTGCSFSFRPYGIATDSQNLIMTADSINNCIHIIDHDGQFLRYIDCLLQYPWGLCVDSKDNIFVSEYNTGKIKKIQYYV